jgi:cytochrome b subunit of formate dehydrogenase
MFAMPEAMTKQWRAAGLLVVAAAFSFSAALTSIVNRGVHWSLVLPGIVIALAGVQVRDAVRLTRRLEPDRLRSWMVALPILLYIIGGASIVIGLWAFAYRGGAI